MSDLPPLEKRVIVTMDDGVEFEAMRIIVVGPDEEDCWAWAVAEDDEPKCPPCWCDGVCWESNSEHKQSRQPVAWRNI